MCEHNANTDGWDAGLCDLCKALIDTSPVLSKKLENAILCAEFHLKGAMGIVSGLRSVVSPDGTLSPAIGKMAYDEVRERLYQAITALERI